MAAAKSRKLVELGCKLCRQAIHLKLISKNVTVSQHAAIYTLTQASCSKLHGLEDL